MAETLKQTVEKLAGGVCTKLQFDADWQRKLVCDAIFDAIRAALAEPNAKQLNAGVAVGQEMYDADKAVPLIVYRVYEAMAAERLKELE